MSFGARAFIRLGALDHNLAVIRKAAPNAAIMAVVKANAYGHGLSVVASALSGVDSFAVARPAEAGILRQAGVTQPIVLLSGVHDAEELALARDLDCEIVVHCLSQVELLEADAGLQTTVWLKFDTGMNRLGFPIGEARSLIARLQDCAAIRELRLMTHLANADDQDDPKTDRQLASFASVASEFQGDISVANSGGIFGWPQSVRADYVRDTGRTWVRPGIAMYGISPFPDRNGSDLGLRPVMQFESKLIATKCVRRGDRVGYGGTWAAQRDTVLGIVSAGYGDGYTRALQSGTPVHVNGRKLVLAGAISMDMAAIDLGPDAGDRVGDAVVLWGDELPVEEIARQAGMSAYQLVCGVMNREASTIVS